MPDAAIDAYEHMLRESQGRSERFRRQISETLPLVVRAALPQEGHEQIVVEAHNNLGVALLRKAELGDANVDALSDEAISHFQWGRDTQPGTAWTNIARGYWMKRNYNEFVGAMENALKSGTNREEQSEMLLNLSIKADDPQVRYVGISAYLEQVEAEPSWRADRLRSLSSMVASLVPMPEAATLRARIANLQTDKRGRE
jgi:hypothetical protein